MSGPGTIAFTDIVGFTAFTAAAGDVRALEVLDTQRSIVDELLPPGGRVVKELGDGLLLWIDAAAAAVRLGRDLQRAFQRVTLDGSSPLWVRIGMHWGDPARRAHDLVGHDVNTAARIVDQAGPGETLASADLVERCDVGEVGVDAQPIGPVMLKGLPTPIWLYRLT